MSVCAQTHIHWSRDEDVTYDCRNIWIHMFCALVFVFFFIFNSSIPSFIHSFIHSFLFLDDVVAAAYGILLLVAPFRRQFFHDIPFSSSSSSSSSTSSSFSFISLPAYLLVFIYIFVCCHTRRLDIISDSNGSMRASFLLPFAPVRSHFQRIMRDCHLCILLLLLYMYMVFCHKCILKSS